MEWCNLTGWPTEYVCASLGARSVLMRVASSTANVGLCIYIYMGVRTYVMVSQFQLPKTNLSINYG